MEWTTLLLGYAVVLLIGSSITFIVFAWDKRRSRRGGWRVSERTLHTLELLGGWPGAWLAMRWLWHKSSKRSYRRVFFAIVALHLLGMAAVSFGWITGS